MTISRRDSLKWTLAASAAGLFTDAVLARGGPIGETVRLDHVSQWPKLELVPITGQGYGKDPDMMNPETPWPLTLNSSQRALINNLGDWLLPADSVSRGAGECDIAAFFDEWISAPYPSQQNDRVQLLSLLMWIDEQSRLTNGKYFVYLTKIDQKHLIEDMLDYYKMPRDVTLAFVWFRAMTIYGYYSMPENLAAAGMEPERPIIGDYPGPSDEAMTHLNNLLVSLKLEPYSSSP
jgi:hypothetical protein